MVGIGASAGGLDPLRELVAGIPRDTPFAFVVLQHLPPSQIGRLASLLSTIAKVPVIDVSTGHRVERGTILVVPPHTSARLYRGALVLRTSAAGARPHLPIDELFGSLAQTLAARAIGVVLSGTASDGTEGLRAIHEAGGATFAQEPASAQFDEMPRNAIAAGVVDLVMPPADIANRLHDKLATGATHERADTPAIDDILDKLREASGVDFSTYKRATIERRLARLLAKYHLSSLDDYGAFLAAHPEAAREVYEDLLVHVTEFFRDPRALDKAVSLVAADVAAAPDAVVRAWVPGCSTGEEVYTLAILLRERLGSERRFQMFGSDLSGRAIEIARLGRYPETIAPQVGPERLARWFRHDDDGYRIVPELRERCVFTRHDVASDPPFSKLQLVSCRNVLIYLGPELQQRVFPVFHYALEQPGYLLLGRAESVGAFEGLFSTVDAEARLYARRNVPTSFELRSSQTRVRLPSRRNEEPARSRRDVQGDADHVLLANYAPPSVLVDEAFDVIQFRGRTGLYLEAPPGQPQVNVLRMARDGLSAELALALRKARDGNVTVRRTGLVVRDRGEAHPFQLAVVPLRASGDGKRHYLCVFEPAATKGIKTHSGKLRPRERAVIDQLRDELATTKEAFHTLATEHYATNEELGAANEELQSANEELQAGNEELQTAKEEIQSSNEELEALNDELKRGNEKLRAANDDIVNVMESVEIAIIIVDERRRIRQFTPSACAVMNLLPGDVGRPITDLRPSVPIADLDAQIANVITTLVVHESEVSDGEHSYRMQIRPYRTASNTVRGAVISLVDIGALRAARDHARAIVAAVPSPLVVLDENLVVRTINAAFGAGFGGTVIGRPLLELGDWRAPQLRAGLEAAVAGTPFDELEVEYRDAGGTRQLLLAGRPVAAFGESRSILVGIVDITLRQRLELAREEAERERDAFLDAVSHELRTPLSAILLWAEALRGLSPDDPRHVHSIDTIIGAARDEARLVDDLFELAASRSARLAINIESVDPTEVVAAVVAAARPDAEAKHIAVNTTLAGGPRITIDPHRLGQIASRLVANAIKFTPAGGAVDISLALHDGIMELRVTDTGAGIAAEQLGRIFEPFAGDRSSTRSHAGLGIGLALVHHLVARHAGTIEARSDGVGHGSTFVVRIPSRSLPEAIQ